MKRRARPSFATKQGFHLFLHRIGFRRFGRFTGLHLFFWLLGPVGLD